MGCSEDKDRQSFDEIELRSSIKALGFHRHESEVLDLSFRKYSQGDTISPGQLSFILRQLRLPSPQGGNLAVVQFYESFKVKEGYQRRPLIVASVLLGQAKENVKADLLFEAFDDDASRRLELTEFETMWEVLVSLALTHLPAMMQVPSHSIQTYLERLPNGTQQAKAMLKAELFGGAESIDMLRFRYMVTHSKLKPLLDPSELRTTIADFNVEIKVKTPIHLGKSLRTSRKLKNAS